MASKHRFRLTRRPRALLATLLCGAVASAGVVAAAPSASGSTEAHHWRVLVGNQSKNMAIQGMRFLPRQIWVDEGDTVTWKANAAEIHTVTFFPGGKKQATLPPFDPTDPTQTMRAGGKVYDPSKYFTSGILSTSGTFGAFPTIPVYSRYTLKFTHDGNYTYYCLVHGMMMSGVVHVREEGTPYPFTQAQYDHQASARAAALLADGRDLMASTRAKSTPEHVFTGAEDSMVMVMRFLRHTVKVPVGTTVTFDNINLAVPHTVTFGPEQTGPAALAPYGDPSAYSGGQLSSGILPPGATFAVTFTKAGTYPYICMLHDEMGMVGTVVVQ